MDQNNVPAWIGRGRNYLLIREFDQALACFERALSLDSKSSEAWKEKGALLRERERFPEALSCYQAALDLDPSDPDARKRVRDVTEEMGRRKSPAPSS
jgi:tetratricopeptide (TPR) repeat protein